jgi:antirestriction protein ArdC
MGVALCPRTEIQTPSPETPTRRDFRQEVTDSIIQMLENGVAPWQKLWEPAYSGCLMICSSNWSRLLLREA